jgi:hypothetical protein
MIQHLRVAAASVALLLLARIAPAQDAQSPSKPTLEQLQRELEEVQAELTALKAEGRDASAREKEAEARYQTVLEELDAREKSPALESAPTDAWYKRFTLGGYGEIHFSSIQGPGNESIDLARFVGYVGYSFSDWIQLHSEVEIEHALVAPDGAGELSVEQLHFDFLLDRHFNLRVGRFLTPLGIINKTHEPPTFNGVLRPDFETFVIPTTWMMDGAGAFGDVNDSLKYEIYVGSSLDGSGFDPVLGIREGRQEGIPGLSQPGLAARLDYFALQSTLQSLRIGMSFFGGGLNNGPGGTNPGIDADLQVYCADFQYSIADFDFRGAYAFENIDGAASIGNNVASEIDGYYVEGAYHFWPARWKEGRLARSDAVAFVRYDDVDTQKAVPTGVTPDPHGDRNSVTLGLSFFPTDNVVIKTDYQFYDDASSDGPGDRFNVGLGFSF